MPADEFSLKVSFLMGFFGVLFLFLDAIPTVGFSDPILSYFSALRFNFDGVRMLKDGYQKTTPGLFKIAGFRRWMVLIAGSELIEDVKRASDDVLSGIEPAIELLQPEYTLGILDMNDTFHIDIIRSKLTRNIAVIFKEVREELVMAMDDFIPMSGDEWVKVPIQETLQRVICCVTNRIFVGVPLCRDYDYQTLNLPGQSLEIWHDHQLVSDASQAVHSLLYPIVSRMISSLPSQIQQEIELIRPMVEERIAKLEEYGEDWDDKPDDLLMWLMSRAKGVESYPFNVLGKRSHKYCTVFLRILNISEYIEPLRQEVDAVIAEDGRTKAGIDKMYKIDSFIRETQRIDGFTLLSFNRLALRPFTLSNGVTIPAGTLVSIPASAIHTDERIYSNPDEFDGFRFAKLRESEEDTMTSRHQAVSTSNEHLAFGLGRHACPGRFFAVNEVKALFAHIIATYDIKFEEGKGVPRELCIAGLRFPGKANVMFRTRQKG
ncbi:cytochrome P450 [Russula ochroleuca]|uniref:Cytochrome P450 n=1 Tax=Russula ochroleuca TaxID=152965 RepID=A0A9P5JX87_9AGAM|nr:cytochrome P450 [Russula ochroleuca]